MMTMSVEYVDDSVTHRFGRLSTKSVKANLEGA